jgi:hypothetical protein
MRDKVVKLARLLFFRIDTSELNIYKATSHNELALVECAPDERQLRRILKALSNLSINPCGANVTGFWPNIGLICTLKSYNLFSLLRTILINIIYFKRWSSDYKSCGVNKVIYIEKSTYFFQIKALFMSYKLYKNLKKSKNLHQLVMDGVLVGDLIYATYIRFREKKTIRYEDTFLWYLIYKTLCIQEHAINILHAKKIHFYLTGFTSYVQHGVMARMMISRGIPTYSLANNSRDIARLHLQNDYIHKPRYWEYSNLIKSKSPNKELYVKSKNLMDARFSGVIDPALSYMRSSPFGVNAKEFKSDCIGVVYLHDFFDSAFDHRTYLFDDLYIWATHTLELIQKNGLPIAVKPHPNQIPENIEIINELKNKYSRVQWIDSEVSNASIFKKSRAGISVFGTVLFELAYHKKVAISAGDHPASAFDLAYQPSSIDEYDNLLLNINELIPKSSAKEHAIKYYLAHNFMLPDGDIELM